jgi:hypothetical protein
MLSYGDKMIKCKMKIKLSAFCMSGVNDVPRPRVVPPPDARSGGTQPQLWGHLVIIGLVSD